MYIGNASISSIATLTLLSASFEVSINTAIIAATAGKSVRVYAVKLVAASASDVKWETSTGTDIEGTQSFPLNGGYTEAVDPPAYLFSTPSGQGLSLVTNAAVAGRVSYWLE